VFLHAESQRERDASELPAPPATRFRKILVVDDDPSLRDALQRGLHRGREVQVAADSATAMRLAEAHPPELAVVDLQIGTENGIELVRELRSAFPDTTIVVMSGFGSIDATVAAMRAGADDVISKPFTTAELLRRAGGALGELQIDAPSLQRALWEHCSRVLSACGGNKSLAAKKLRMHRSRLRRILAKGPPEE
jgi:two-component system response regulator RegA